MSITRVAFCAAIGLLTGILPVRSAPSSSWPKIDLANPREVQLQGPVGGWLQLGIERLVQPPYSTDWLLADVSFKVNRIFTNYSGDVSGRFIELASLTTPPERLTPPTLQPVLNAIASYQKPDGHFGLDMDFNAPIKKLSPPIPMFWGNARLLVGLVTAANELHDTNLLAAARRLGDFYVNTAEIFCSPARESELRSTGTGGDGYTCCYFPAIESLTLLYRATGEQKYLQQARRMAEWFKKFDVLPTDHSHGNLCAWRGILELYHITGELSYLDRAMAKWETAMQDGFVWPLGGVGEHWYLFHNGDEGCSESDWLRFNLELWRCTGQTRFLDTAERLLLNQYGGNQCPNGGYGWRSFDGDAAGPLGTKGAVEEWNFCCSFHGPLGLHFLKSYLVAGSERGIFVNFPLDFSAPVNSGGKLWRVTAKSQLNTDKQFQIQVLPPGNAPANTTLFIRRPEWASGMKVTNRTGAAMPFKMENGYARLERAFQAGETLFVAFESGLRVEHRRFQPAPVDASRILRFRDVALLQGPEVLFAAPAPTSGRMTLLAQIKPDGRLALCAPAQSGLATIRLPGFDAGLEQIISALESAQPVVLRPEAEMRTRQRTTFMHDLIVVPSELLPAPALAQFAARLEQANPQPAGPIFGDNLEKRANVWLAPAGWQFNPDSLDITGGDVGLLDGENYSDYRFEFDFELPAQGQGITGWVVRAKDSSNCLMFQLQSADSTYKAPEFKTQPNTLRPHVRRNGEWTITSPVPLPREVRRGEKHHVTIECRGPQITVFLDGTKIHSQDDAGFRNGSVGFRASGPVEEGIFRNISLHRLP